MQLGLETRPPYVSRKIQIINVRTKSHMQKNHSYTSVSNIMQNVRRVQGNTAGTSHWCAVKGLRNYITGPGVKGSLGAALPLIFLAFGYTTNVYRRFNHFKRNKKIVAKTYPSLLNIYILVYEEILYLQFYCILL
jgi:hypothetical protein